MFLILGLLVLLSCCLYMLYLHSSHKPEKKERKTRGVMLETNGDAHKEDEPLLDTSHPVVAKKPGTPTVVSMPLQSVQMMSVQQMPMPTVGYSQAPYTGSAPYAYVPVKTTG